MYIVKLKNGQWILLNRLHSSSQFGSLIWAFDVFDRNKIFKNKDISTITPIN